MPAIDPLLQISAKISVLPIIHGSGQCAVLVRRWLLEHRFDCLAVPLPDSFREPVEEAVLSLPTPAIVLQARKTRDLEYRQWTGDPGMNDAGIEDEEDEYDDAQDDIDEDDEEDDLSDEDDERDLDADDESWDTLSYVPIDPCQPVIAGIRAAMGEHIERVYIDLETENFSPNSACMPDPYALHTVSPERFAAAMLPCIPMPADQQLKDRILHMAIRLRELEKKHERVLLICSVLHWPWIRQAYTDLETTSPGIYKPQHETPDYPPQIYSVDERNLLFLFGELPFITGLYERARAELFEDDNLSIDGVKELLMAARDSYLQDLGKRARRITPFLLSQCLKYIRNLSLLSHRMTPDLYTIVVASKQILGDQFALHVVQVAKEYPYAEKNRGCYEQVGLGIELVRFPDGEAAQVANRLPGPSSSWKSVELNRRPTDDERKRWTYQWNPFGQCSYPPEDQRIEQFRTRVFERALAITGSDLARTEKFTTSVKDGIDIRDTLRHWYEKQIYVKVNPPNRGTLDACVMFFDSPADPRHYPWRTTWFAEHDAESTLAFYATDFRSEPVGPGICMATYGGAMFLFPPVVIPDIWTDRRLDFTETLDERLLAAACMHARSRQVALLSWLPPGGGWKRLARRFGKHLIHVPMGAFSEAEVAQLRMVHVLNGTKVRSYAEHFIRKA
jgi:hypothetical protein